jgi:hypothetical protein
VKSEDQEDVSDDTENEPKASVSTQEEANLVIEEINKDSAQIRENNEEHVRLDAEKENINDQQEEIVKENKKFMQRIKIKLQQLKAWTVRKYDAMKRFFRRKPKASSTGNNGAEPFASEPSVVEPKPQHFKNYWRNVFRKTKTSSTDSTGTEDNVNRSEDVGAEPFTSEPIFVEPKPKFSQRASNYWGNVYRKMRSPFQRKSPEHLKQD